jgi:hypothetical protein
MDLACGDTPESVTVGALAAGTYFLLVDGWGSTFDEGTYALTINGTIANGQSCEGALALSGALHCGVGSACAGTLGSRTCEVQPCSDGLDNDSDGDTDFPFDPGCASPADNDETDPATAPVCSNTVDEDADLATDYPMDFGCNSAAGASEAFCVEETDPPVVITTLTTTGTTVGATNDFAALSCSASSGSGPDVALVLQLPVGVTTLVLDLFDSDFDTQVSFQDANCGVEYGCNEDEDLDNFVFTSFLQLSDVAPGNYAIIIDGFSTDSGMYSLDVHGTVASGASCVSPLFAAGVLACPTGTTCTGTPLRCQ